MQTAKGLVTVPEQGFSRSSLYAQDESRISCGFIHRTAAVVVFLLLALASVQGQVTWTSIDTMKESRDHEVNNVLSQAEIDQIVALIATANVTHITIDTHYEYASVMQQWVTAIRAQSKKIHWRCAPNQWQDNNGTTGIMTPTQFNTAMGAFIRSHASFFESGDIFEPITEPEDSHYWANKYGSPVGWPGNTAATDEYNSFVISSSDTADNAFNAIGVSGVITDIHSMNSFMATNVLSSAAVTRLHNHVALDTYPEKTNTDSATCASLRKTEYDAAHSKWPNALINVGEMGYANAMPVSDTVQNNVLSAEFTMMEGLSYLGGVNYWVGPGSDTAGGHTFVMTKDSSGNWVARPAFLTLSNFFGKVLVPANPPPPPTSLSATPGDSQASLTWMASTGATSYNVKRSTTSGGPYATVASGVAGTSYTNVGLAGGTTYFYVVTAVNKAGESGNSNQASATPTGSGGGTAKAVSIHFVGRGTAMGSAETAGVVSKSHWNNASNASGSIQTLNDETGAASGVTVTWSGDHTTSEGITDTAGNNRMMNGYLNTADASTTIVTVSRLIANANGYDVYVYCQENITSTRVAAYTISGSGITTTTVHATDPAGGFKGTFTEAVNSTGNYVKFTIGDVSDFTIKATPVSSTDSYMRAPVNGIQIIPR